MKHILGVLSFAALLTVPLAFGQETRITANIPFPFIVEGKTLPPGNYDFVPDDAAEQMRIIGKSASAFAPIQSRLGKAIHTSSQDAHIVFDQVGDAYTLSELWIPDQDGWLLFATKGKHEHRTINVPR